MQTTSFSDQLAAYWSATALQTNLLVFMNLAGALLLGGLVGYERAYRGRAAGMRTYGLVCMASAGLTVIAGYPALWFGGQHGVVATADPTRVMQGIVTGIGFLGAGVIVKEGLNISGLTTAASIWAASCIGVLIGVGFYGAAILLAAMSAATMMWGSRLEEWLPAHPALQVSLSLRAGSTLDLAALHLLFEQQGFALAPGSLSIQQDVAQQNLRFVVYVRDRRQAASMGSLAAVVAAWPEVLQSSLCHARN